MEKKFISLAGIVFLASFFLQGCLSDIRTDLIKKEGLSSANKNKGKVLLDKAWERQGFDKLENHQVYSFKGKDIWQGAFGKMGRVWPDMESELAFKYEIGTFDGQVAFLDGKRAGEKSGLQNWRYYEVSNKGTHEFIEVNRRIKFGLAAFQYFTEMVGRLRKAPIISYAGEDEMRGVKYDLVFCTWNKAEAHKEVDQYIAWINKETGLMDFTQYTIRENFMKMPGGGAFYGGIEFSDFKSVEGVLIPHEQTVYTFNLKEKKKKNLHQLKISDFNFDDFEVEELRLDKSIQKGGDFKPISSK